MSDNDNRPRCPQCGKEIMSPVSCVIISRMYKGYRKEIVFCSEQCGTHYQMGCEG